MEAGSRLTHYEILSPIGKGGMGEVWRARDTRLGREVAIKTLPREVEQHADWLSRFEREAKVLASLNHPNIATIHGFDRDQGLHFLVLELVGGETLAERLRRGPIPVEESLSIARQIGDALEAAHERGVIHRDLKPANVKITDDGVVKVLDFGLARSIWAEEPGSSSGDAPTMSLETREGAILGTAAYMAPEQARGKKVDKRADIWAFGVVLYEMITGLRPFEGSDLTETLASVVMKDPDFEPVAPRLRRLLKKCLERDPKKRLRDVGDAWELLEESPFQAPASEAPKGKASRLPWVAALVSAAAALVLLFLLLRPSSLPSMIRFEIRAPMGSILPVGTPAVSPDGATLAYVVQDAEGINRIHVRPMNVIETRVLPGTEGAVHPFFSPDGSSLAFSSGGLKRIELSGGSPRDLIAIGGPWHGTWNQAGSILFQRGGVFEISDQGGASKPVAGGEGDTFPAFLSDGKRFLVRVINDKGSSIKLGALGSAERTTVMDNVLSAPVFAPTPNGKAYLLFLRVADLMAQEFDERAGKVLGEPVVLIPRIGRVANPAVMPALGVSRNGVLAYQNGDEAPFGQLTWFNRAGKSITTLAPELAVVDPQISPDENSVVGARATGGRDIWVTDLSRQTSRRITFDDTLDSSAIWSNDGKRIAFRSRGKGLLVVEADGGTPELLTSSEGDLSSWSPDGQYLLYDAQGKITLFELASKKTSSVGSPNAASSEGVFSPDGKFIAYQSNETGRNEVFVQATPPRTGRTQVSIKGGRAPRWGKKELFFVSPDGEMMAVDVAFGERFSSGTPRALFPYGATTGFDVSEDGQRFLIVTPPKEVDSPITVLVNWWVGLERNAK